MDPILVSPLLCDSSTQRPTPPVPNKKPPGLRSTASKSAPPTPRGKIENNHPTSLNMENDHTQSPKIIIEDISDRSNVLDEDMSSATLGDNLSERNAVDDKLATTHVEAGASQVVDAEFPATQQHNDHALHRTHDSLGLQSVPVQGRSISRRPSFRAMRTAHEFSKALKPEEELCSPCEDLRLTIDKFVIDQWPDPESPSNGWPDFHRAKSMGTFRKIQGTADLHCPLCQLLVKSMGTHRSNDPAILDAICKLGWTIDGRERGVEVRSAPDHNASVLAMPDPDLNLSKNIADVEKRYSKRTRRLAVTWSNKPKSVAYIVLVAPQGRFKDDGSISHMEKRDRPHMFLGRLLTAIDQSNLNLAREWLKVCKEHHSDVCQVHADLRVRATKDLRSSTFTVIDVKNMCLTDLPPSAGDQPEQYIALSYTWGEESRISGGHGPASAKLVERFKTTKENLPQLEMRDGIRNVVSNLPMAIQNAIYLTSELGYRYIWVDSLCITQDDNDSWMLNAEVMDVIYGNAELTICAADGDGADKVGLVALFPPKESIHARHAEQYTVDYPISSPGPFEQAPLKLLLSWPSESYIAESRWNTRAWTFQERLLSPRCLIFVAGRMYLQCRSTTMSEDIYSEYAIAGWSVELMGAPAQTLKRIHQEPVKVYKDCLEMYTSRHLTKPGDILAAFNGIENIICRALAIDCDAIFGLPASHFDWALLWEPEELPQRRVVDGRVFPSWSWCGWQGKKISYRTTMVNGPEIDLHEWLLRHTWITYYIRNGRGELRLVWDPKRHKTNEQIDAHWRGYDAPTDGRLPLGTFTFTGSDSPDYDFHGRPWNSNVEFQGRVDCPGSQFLRTTPEFRRNTTVWTPGETSRASKNGPRQDKPLLQFWTYAADFSLVVDTVEQGAGNTTPLGQGLKRFAILDVHGDCVGSCVLAASWADASEEQRRQQRFIALSDAREFDRCEYDSMSAYSEREEPWQLYNVMMLNTRTPEELVSYRAGLGKVFKSAFPNGMNYGWKEIVLG